MRAPRRKPNWQPVSGRRTDNRENCMSCHWRKQRVSFTLAGPVVETQEF
jgi:hypothetical protein